MKFSTRSISLQPIPPFQPFEDDEEGGEEVEHAAAETASCDDTYYTEGRLSTIVEDGESCCDSLTTMGHLPIGSFHTDTTVNGDNNSLDVTPRFANGNNKGKLSMDLNTFFDNNCNNANASPQGKESRKTINVSPKASPKAKDAVDLNTFFSKTKNTPTGSPRAKDSINLNAFLDKASKEFPVDLKDQGERRHRVSLISLTTGEEVVLESDDEFTLVSCSTESLGALTQDSSLGPLTNDDDTVASMDELYHELCRELSDCANFEEARQRLQTALEKRLPPAYQEYLQRKFTLDVSKKLFEDSFVRRGVARCGSM